MSEKVKLVGIGMLMMLLISCSFIASKDNYIPPVGNQKYGTLVDDRNGKTYETIQIGDQIWMAENLNYGKVVEDCRQEQNGIAEQTYYENDPEKGEKYGGLYTWKEIQDTELAPEGWHIPTKNEWMKLKAFLGDSSAQKIKASKQDAIKWDGTNVTGMTIIPSGVAYKDNFGRLGQWAMFWTATERDEEFAWFAQLDGFWYPAPPKYIDIYVGNYYRKENAFSIRCVKDGGAK